MLRSAPRMLASLLVSSALGLSLAGCSMMGGMTGASRDVAVKAKPVAPREAAADDLDGNLRQAKLLRQAGNYDEAIHILSQLLLMAADDPRVVAEYGKSLAQVGRARDATQFLRRAIELNPKDWTLYSALGTSYDQLGDGGNARLAYDHALALKPGEASVLNNYALSRLLAKDPDGARLLIAQAQAAAGAPDAKIARNLALINGMSPPADPGAKPVAVASAARLPDPKIIAPAPQAKIAAVAPPPLPVMTAQPMTALKSAPANTAPQNANDVARLLAGQNPPGANGAPRALTPQMASNDIPLPPAPVVPSGVVMQAVPYDPYAGPVVTLKKPKPRTVAKASAPKAEKTDTAKVETPKPTRTAAATRPDVVPALRIAADKY